MGGWNDPTETIIAGSGQVYVAPVGTALPAAENTALNSAFAGLGYHTEDGVSVNQSREVIKHRAWQTKADIRRTSESEGFQVTFALEQWNEESVVLAFGGGAVSSPSANKYKYTPPTAAAAEYERSLICDVIDGSTILRFVIPKGTPVEGVETQFTRSQMGVLSVTFEAMEPDDGTPQWHLLTNSAAFAAGS
jgi:hypothetical protein